MLDKDSLRIIATPFIYGIDGVLNPTHATELAAESDYKGMQMLPLRRLGNPKDYALPVCYFEDAWNSGTFKECLSGHFAPASRKRLDTPTLIDWILFPHGNRLINVRTRLKEITPTPPRIVHTLEDFRKFRRAGQNCLLEVSPMLGLNIEELLGTLRFSDFPQKCLVLDTWHIRREPNAIEALKYNPLLSGNPFGKWQDSIPRLAPHIALVHVQPSRTNRDELEGLITCEKHFFTELHDILIMISEECPAVHDYVLEYVPRPLQMISKHSMVGTSHEILRTVESLVS